MGLINLVEKVAILVFAVAVTYSVYDYSRQPVLTLEREIIQIIEKRLDCIEQTFTGMREEDENQ
jgi:hypothetical protein